MPKKECSTSKWESIHVTKSSDRLNPVTLVQESVAVDSRRLYIGDKSQWTIKAKSLTKIRLEGDAETETDLATLVLLLATTEISIQLTGFLKTTRESDNWHNFFKRLQAFIKHSNVHLQTPSAALSRGGTAASRLKGPTADHGGFFESTGKMRFSPNRKRQQRETRTSPPVAATTTTRRTFGRKPRPRLTTSQPTVPWDDEDDELVVQPSPPPPRREGKSSWDDMDNHDNDQAIVDTDDEDVLFDNDKKGSAKGNIFQDSDDEDMKKTKKSTKLSTPPPTTTTTTTTSTPVGRRRHVSPASRTSQKIASNNSTVTEEEKVATHSSPSKGGGQRQISSFFAARPATTPPAKPSTFSSFDPSKRAGVAAKTPERPSSTRMIKSSGDWLRSSRAGFASPVRQRKDQLFGTPNGSSRKVSSTKTTREENDDADPIKEFTPPRRTRNPMDTLNLPDNDPDQAKHDLFEKVATADWTRKRKRAPDKTSLTAPRRLSLDAGKKVVDDEVVARKPWRGLRNLGNTCYLNSSIQMLVTLVNTPHGRTNWWDSLRDKGGNLTRSLLQIVDQLLVPPGPNSNTSVVDPSQVKSAVDAITTKFLGFQQHDAHEFLSDLIDSVHEELEKGQQDSSAVESGTAEENATMDDTPMSENQDSKPTDMTPLATDDFRLTLEVCLRCESCGYSRTKEEIYRHLSLDITKQDESSSKASIAAGLSQFFQPQSLEIRCEKCSEGTHATQTQRILSSPKHLLLHLKRFIFVERPVQPANENSQPNSAEMEYVFNKNKAPVELAKELSLQPFCATPSKSDYHLRSLVHHLGMRPSSGHYLADAIRPYRATPSDPATDTKDTETSSTGLPLTENLEISESTPPEEEWITFDDANSCKTTLSKIQANTMKQQTAYMLLYSLEP